MFRSRGEGVVARSALNDDAAGELRPIVGVHKWDDCAVSERIEEDGDLERYNRASINKDGTVYKQYGTHTKEICRVWVVGVIQRPAPNNWP